MSLVAALMQDVISSLTNIVVPAHERQVPEEVVVTTSGSVATLVAPWCDTPEPEAEIGAVTILEVMAADVSSNPVLTTSLAVVPLITTDSEAHAEPLLAREMHLEDIYLIDDPLLNVDMVAGMMEMHPRIGAYVEVCLIRLLPLTHNL
ncbi:hypothetical protein SETIT_3G234800v2 [Setaria italica]|uniref:Uncharacterized protein n=1 Tax=Setaria italica TaxID=4555 RepID=A0A368QK10_SETIT|nr:hypothetical protein SETIT_3G234800v2 [Setaria italica]